MIGSISQSAIVMPMALGSCAGRGLGSLVTQARGAAGIRDPLGFRLAFKAW